MNPWDEYIEKEYQDGGTKKIHKVHIMYIDGDPKLCDGCDEVKGRVASIRFMGSIWCVCKDCIKDLHRAWGEEEERIYMRHKL
jgi:hypothetical protein